MAQNSISPVRSQKSPRRKSPSRRERSPARHRGAYAEKLSSSSRSHKRSRSPELPPPRRERVSSRTKSPKPRKSPSPESHSPVKKRPLSRATSGKREKSRSPPPPSPKRGKLPPRVRSSVSPSPEKNKQSVRSRSPRRARSSSPDPKTLSPRSKRLLRAKAERDAEKKSVMEHDGNHDRKGERVAHREKDSDREIPIEKMDKRSKDDVDNGSSRSRQKRSVSPSDPHHRSRHRSRSPSNNEKRGRAEGKSSRDSEQRSRNSDDDSIAKMKAAEDTLQAKEKQKPSFELSGKLAAETNRYRGVTLLFNEPPDARKPDVRWRLYVFKGGEALNEPLYVHRQSCYLFGRERRVADIPTDHPSCSKQHAVLQYRQVEEENADTTTSKRVRPYVMDLGSTNGTFINEEQIEPQRYYELFEKDTIKFGNSSREYVLLHENSAA